MEDLLKKYEQEYLGIIRYHASQVDLKIEVDNTWGDLMYWCTLSVYVPHKYSVDAKVDRFVTYGRNLWKRYKAMAEHLRSVYGKNAKSYGKDPENMPSVTIDLELPTYLFADFSEREFFRTEDLNAAKKHSSAYLRKVGTAQLQVYLLIRQGVLDENMKPCLIPDSGLETILNKLWETVDVEDKEKFRQAFIEAIAGKGKVWYRSKNTE